MRTPLLKKTIVFLVIFLSLVVGLFLSRPSWRFWEKKPNLLAIVAVKKEDINQLVVIKAGSEKKIEKKDNHWQVENFATDEKVVTNCLDLLLGLKKETLISENEAKFSKYDIGDQSPKIKLAASDKVLATVVIGKPGPTYGTNYFQIEGGDKIWLSGENLATACQPPEWREMTIFSFDAQKVKAYQLQESGSSYTLKKNSDKWELDGQPDEKIKTDKINSTLSAIANLKAKDLLWTDKETAKFSTATTVTVTLDDDKKYTLQISPPLTTAKDSDFKARGEDDKLLYLISSYTKGEIAPRLAEITEL